MSIAITGFFGFNTLDEDEIGFKYDGFTQNDLNNLPFAFTRTADRSPTFSFVGSAVQMRPYGVVQQFTEGGGSLIAFPSKKLNRNWSLRFKWKKATIVNGTDMVGFSFQIYSKITGTPSLYPLGIDTSLVPTKSGNSAPINPAIAWRCDSYGNETQESGVNYFFTSTAGPTYATFSMIRAYRAFPGTFGFGDYSSILAANNYPGKTQSSWIDYNHSEGMLRFYWYHGSNSEIKPTKISGTGGSGRLLSYTNPSNVTTLLYGTTSNVGGSLVEIPYTFNDEDFYISLKAHNNFDFNTIPSNLVDIELIFPVIAPEP